MIFIQYAEYSFLSCTHENKQPPRHLVRKISVVDWNSLLIAQKFVTLFDAENSLTQNPVARITTLTEKKLRLQIAGTVGSVYALTHLVHATPRLRCDSNIHMSSHRYWLTCLNEILVFFEVLISTDVFLGSRFLHRLLKSVNVSDYFRQKKIVFLSEWFFLRINFILNASHLYSIITPVGWRCKEHFDLTSFTRYDGARGSQPFFL